MQQNRKAELVLLFVTLLWGATFIATKQGLRSAPPVFFLGFRFLIAALLLLPVCYRELIKISPVIFRRGLVLGILMFTGYAFQNVSLVYTTAGKSALITYFFALIVPFLQIPFTGKPLNRGNIIGLAIVVTGLVLLNLPAKGDLNPGDVLAFGSAVSYSFFIIFLDRYGHHGNVPVLTFIQFAVTALLSFLLSAMIESGAVFFDANLGWSLFYLSFFGSFICLLLMNLYQRYVTPVKAVIIYAMEPVFAVFFGMIFLAEFFTPAEWAGAALVVSGVIFSGLYKSSKI